MSYHDIDSLKRELERLSLELHHIKGDRERDRNKTKETAQSLESAQSEITELTRRVGELEDRTTHVEEAMPSSTAQLLVLASSRISGMLGILAHDEGTTIRKLEAVTEKLPNRTITGTDGSPYLTRWYLYPARPRDADDEGSDLRFAVFLHKFHRGDVDRDQHNHPWDLSVAIVLAGGYREERGSEVKTFTPGMINVIRHNDFHRVDLLDPAAGSWSLFVAGSKTGEWGFRNKGTGTFISQKDYLATK